MLYESCQCYMKFTNFKRKLQKLYESYTTVTKVLLKL